MTISWRRFIFFSLTSQLFNAGTNALLVVLLARALSRHGFGVQALAMTVLPLVLSAFRGTCLEPAVVHGIGSGVHRFVFADAMKAGLLCAIGTVLLPVIAKGSVSVGSWLAVGAALTVLEEAGRWLLARKERPDLAALADITWAAIQVGVLALVGFHSSVMVTVSWAAGAGASVIVAWGAVFAISRSGNFVEDGQTAKTQPTARYRHHRNAGLRNWHWGFEYLVTVSGPQLVLLLAPLGGGVDVSGALSAAMSLSGAATVLTGGGQQVAISRLRLISSASEMRKWAVIIGASLGFAVFACSIPLMFIPTSLGARLLGPSWEPARLVLLAIIIQKTAVAISMGPIFVTRRLPEYRIGLWYRLPLTLATVSCAIGGAAIYGAKGAAIALAAGAVASIGIWGTIVARMTRTGGEMEQYFNRRVVPAPLP